MKELYPKNITAQLEYEAKGNPPGAHPQSAVGNFFPGLEFNFLNVWRRIFKDIELLESQPVVIAVDEDAPAEIQALLGGILYSVDDAVLLQEAVGPGVEGGFVAQEWGNFLAKVHLEKGGTGQTADCVFALPAGDSGEFEIVNVNLEVNALFETDSALLSKEYINPGEITESLCSPWQTDFIGCACYYWAANRPDYVNTWEDGTRTGGHNWLTHEREDKPVEGLGDMPFYTLEEGKTLEHEDIMQNWESKLKFVFKGRDEDQQ